MANIIAERWPCFVWCQWSVTHLHMHTRAHTNTHKHTLRTHLFVQGIITIIQSTTKGRWNRNPFNNHVRHLVLLRAPTHRRCTNANIGNIVTICTGCRTVGRRRRQEVNNVIKRHPFPLLSLFYAGNLWAILYVACMCGRGTRTPTTDCVFFFSIANTLPAALCQRCANGLNRRQRSR